MCEVNPRENQSFWERVYSEIRQGLWTTRHPGKGREARLLFTRQAQLRSFSDVIFIAIPYLTSSLLSLNYRSSQVRCCLNLSLPTTRDRLLDISTPILYLTSSLLSLNMTVQRSVKRLIDLMIRSLKWGCCLDIRSSNFESSQNRSRSSKIEDKTGSL
jgi:hypothetical protein